MGFTRYRPRAALLKLSLSFLLFLLRDPGPYLKEMGRDTPHAVVGPVLAMTHIETRRWYVRQGSDTPQTAAGPMLALPSFPTAAWGLKPLPSNRTHTQLTVKESVDSSAGPYRFCSS
ncbi:hypothetical protein L1987_53315 [Smallanthus sonchifolius]|uniref:Uncharacterized protein n=1 Tax=Smallanthus sonchifolius TaxID=185202 RepID=A0ACB9EWC8_9ASTR|nr:hypothetical protein L1987_53315 [Smallanthus sonchifolius]